MAYNKTWKSRELRSWAAGFFDGEGYVGLKRAGKGTHRKYLTACVVQKGLPLIKRFQSIIGFGNITGPNKRGIYSIQYYGYDKVIELFKILKPFLGPVKHEQFANAIYKALQQRKVG